MKKLFVLLISFMFFISCNQENPTKLSDFEIPQLLDRPEKLKYFNEWAEVRSQYADLKFSLSKDPKSIDALIQLANLYILEARVTGEHGHYYNAALKMIDQLFTSEKLTNDQKFLALSAKASVKLSLHSFDEALQIATQALSLNPYNAKIYGALVDANVELGQYDKAVEMADKMVSIRPDLRSYSRVSYLREIFGMPDEAISAMKMAVEAGSPGSDEKSWAALQLAELYLRYNKWNESENVLLELLSERPDYPFAKAALAEVYLKQNKKAEAKKEILEACQIIPEFGFFVQLASFYKQEGQLDLMKSTLDEVMQMLQDDMDHGHNMSLEYANIYLNFYNDPDTALKYLSHDMNLRPDNIDINRLMAKIYLHKKDKQNATIYLAKASKTNSKHPELLALQHELNQI